MKIALIQPTGYDTTIRIIDGKFAETTILGHKIFDSGEECWEFLTGDERWVPMESEDLENVECDEVAGKENEMFTRLVYRVPADVDLYTVEELKELLPVTIHPAEEPQRFCHGF